MQTVRLIVSGDDVIPFVTIANPDVSVDAIEHLVQGSLQGLPENDADDLRTQLYRARHVGLALAGHVPPKYPGDRFWGLLRWGSPGEPENVLVRRAARTRYDVSFKVYYQPDAWLETVARMHPELVFRMVHDLRRKKMLTRCGPHAQIRERLIPAHLWHHWDPDQDSTPQA